MADYVVWRNGLGTAYTQNDYDVWRAHFGQTAASGSAGALPAPAGVPEPSTFALAALALATCAWRAHRRRAVPQWVTGLRPRPL
jgi:hypothetical protein